MAWDDMNKWVYVAISAVSDFGITGGGAYLALGLTTSLPTMGQIVTCIILGTVQALRGVQKTLSPPPV